jgi:hypothetical protein
MLSEFPTSAAEQLNGQYAAETTGKTHETRESLETPAEIINFFPDYRGMLEEIFNRTSDKAEARKTAFKFLGLDEFGKPPNGYSLKEYVKRLKLVSLLGPKKEKIGVEVIANVLKSERLIGVVE